MIARLCGVAVGVWLMFAPAVLDHGGAAEASDRIVGPIAASIAFVAIWPVVRPLRWLLLPCAGWLVIAPLVLGHDDLGAAVNSVVCGIALGITAPLGPTDERFGGGWRAVLAS